MATETISKRCPKCKQFKPLSEFYKDSRNKDGVRANCKSCHKSYKKAYRQSEKGRAVHRKGNAKYRQTPKGKIAKQKAIAKYQKTLKGKATMKRYYACNPNYIKATNAVNHAIQAGRLPRANSQQCHYCPHPAQEYHHWHGYEPEHWLDVVPACIKCHSNQHRKTA